MSNTTKAKVYHPMSKEKAWARKLTRRKYRAAVKARMDAKDYDNIPIKKGTCGWMTW